MCKFLPASTSYTISKKHYCKTNGIFIRGKKNTHGPIKHGPPPPQTRPRPVVTRTASQLLHQRHPRQVSAVATLRSLQNAINMVPRKEQERGNRMGDCFSKKESLKILNNACNDHDAPLRRLRDGVQSLWTGGMIGASTRCRKAKAVRCDIRDYSFYVDNVGRVR